MEILIKLGSEPKEYNVLINGKLNSDYGVHKRGGAYVTYFKDEFLGCGNTQDAVEELVYKKIKSLRAEQRKMSKLEFNKVYSVVYQVREDVGTNKWHYWNQCKEIKCLDLAKLRYQEACSQMYSDKQRVASNKEQNVRTTDGWAIITVSAGEMPFDIVAVKLRERYVSKWEEVEQNV